MPTIIFINDDGTRDEVSAQDGLTVMQAAVFDNIAGIVGDCGGNTSCGTCHVYVQEPWDKMLPAPGTPECIMLGSIPNKQPNSRLGCCITIKPALDGITVKTPKSQYW